MAINPAAKFREIQAKAQAFIDEKWIEQGSAPRSWFHQFVHFWVVVGKYFMRNRCPVHASALAYTTLIALVPVLAVVVGVSTSLLKSEGEKPIDEFLDTLVRNIAPMLDLVSSVSSNVVESVSAPANVSSNAVEGVPSHTSASTNMMEGAPARTYGVNKVQAQSQKNQPTTYSGRQEVVRNITQYINNIQSGAIGITGVISLIIVAIFLLSNIEATFNDMWGVTHGRSWFSRVVQYWAAITLGPIFIFTALGLNLSSTTAIQSILNSMPVVGNMLATLALTLLGFFVLICGFTLFYKIMPNTQVHWSAALIGGLVGGSLWYLNNLLSFVNLSRVINFSKIYGGFAVVPLFLIGMYFSWLILLFGAQVAYTFQNRAAYLQEKRAEGVNQRGKEYIALRIMTWVGKRFHLGEKAPTETEIGLSVGAPFRSVCQVLTVLVKNNLMREVTAEETSYVPARPLDRITCQDVLLAVRGGPCNEFSTRDDPAKGIVLEEFNRIQTAEQKVAQATTILDLITRLPEEEKVEKFVVEAAAS